MSLTQVLGKLPHRILIKERSYFRWKRDAVLAAVFSVLTLVLCFIPTGFEDRQPKNSVRCRGRIIDVDNSEVKQFGIVKIGTQDLFVQILDGPFAGKKVRADNEIIGKLELDKVFKVNDTALMVLSLKDGEIFYANAQDHFRLHTQLVLLICFALLLVSFAGWTGVKALLSFIFAALAIWKILVPLFLKNIDPIMVSLAVVTVLTAAIIFLVGGLTRRGLVAFFGAFFWYYDNMCACVNLFQGLSFARSNSAVFRNTSLFRLSPPQSNENLPGRYFHSFGRRRHGPGHGRGGKHA